MACFIGGSINYVGIEVPIIADKILAILSSAALPLGLFICWFWISYKRNKLFKK